MTRAIFKLKGGSAGSGAISIALGPTTRTANFGAQSNHTFTLNAVGSGADRTILAFVTADDQVGGITGFTSAKVDGNNMTLLDSIFEAPASETILCGIYAKKLTTETGNVDITVQVNTNDMTSLAVTYLILNGVSSITPIDTAKGGTTAGTSLATTTTLQGDIDGIECGVVGVGNNGPTVTWGSSMTERVDVQTGGNPQDHRHSVGYDLLTSARAAATETISVSVASRERTLVTATLR